MMETRMGEREAEALAIEYRPLGTLRKNPRNARTHAKKQVKAIAESIEAFGFTSPILIDEDGMILAGHGRFAAAKLLGLQAVPTIRKGDLSEAQKRAVVLAENQLAARAGWDQDMLVAELGDLAVLLPEAGFSIEVTGFEVGHVDCILSDAAEEVAASREDDLGPVPEKAVTQCGDAWIMGRHRIICGDARDAAVIRALLGDEVADMMITDPPYNVAIPGHAMGRGKVQHDNFAMACGEMSEDEFRDFLAQVLRLGAAVSRPGALHYVTMDWRHIADLIGVGKTVYDELLNLCVWVKSNPGQGSLY